MLVQVVTDNHIQGTQELTAWVTDVVKDACERFTPQLVRVEVHLSDENAGKPGKNDKSCLLEARLSGMEPVVVSQKGALLDQCVDAAVDTLVQTLDRKLGRLSDRKGTTSFSGE